MTGPDSDRRPRLTTSEVAEQFGLSRTTLDRWIEQGRIPQPARDPGTGWPIWGQSELDAIVKAMRNKGKRL